MNLSGRLLLLSFCALLSAPATAVVWRTDAPPSAEFELAHKLGGAVGKVGGGSGTLIARDWVITAAHVAADLKPGDKVRFGERDHAIAAVILHPLGTPDPARPQQPPEVDLALIQLAEPVTDATPIMPNRAADELGKTVAIAGYGDFGPVGAALAHGDGRLRVVENQVSDAGPLRLFLPFDAPPAGLSLEGIGAAGDSGGPLVRMDALLGLTLFGVSSGADGPPGAYGTVDVYTRISSQMQWIEMTAGEFRQVEAASRVEPQFPHEALRKRISGGVIVEATIGADGVPRDIKIIKSEPAGMFDAGVLKAFAKWRFKPRLEAGVAVPTVLRQKIEFNFGP